MGTSTAVLSFLDNSFNLSGASIQQIQYQNGTVTLANSSTEDLIGTQMVIVGINLIGPSPDVPGAYAFTDGSFAVLRNGMFVYGGNLTDVILYPDNSVPGFNSTLQGDLGWDSSSQQDGSEFLNENMAAPNGSIVFIHTNLLDSQNMVVFNTPAQSNIQFGQRA